MKTTPVLQTVLKIIMILSFATWVVLWLLKPTEFWTKEWKKAENRARNTVFGYQGLDFVVYSLPVIVLAITGFMNLYFYSKEQKRRQTRVSVTSLSKPIIVHSPLGILSSGELIAAALFFMFLGWTMYAHISKDFKKITPIKLLKLNMLQYKFNKFATRFGLLAEVCLAFLLLPVLRRMSIFRLIGLQFEASIRYHIFLGTFMIFFATFHGLGTLFIWGVKHQLQDKIWKWQKTGRVYLAGEIALVIGLVIWITSLPQIRRKRFELFYYTHHLYALFLVFFLFHTGDRHFYMIFSGVLLFSVDKLLRIIESRPNMCLLSARLFPSGVVELTLPKYSGLKYTPTSVIFLKVPNISKFEWHPFSITSSSNADSEKLTVMVKSEGSWTSSLYNLIMTEVDSDPHQEKYLPVSVEGPYGPASADFLRHDSLLLVAGGIGLTPFLSILQEICSSQNIPNLRLPTQVTLIYATKKSQDISLLSPISHLLLNQSMNKLTLKLRIYVTQEVTPVTTSREFLKKIPKVQTVNFSTRDTNYQTVGLESLPWMAIVVGLSSIIFLVALICLNHIFLHPEKKNTDKKNPSLITDLVLLCSLSIAAVCSTLVIALIRWKKTKKEISPSFTQQNKNTELSYFEASDVVEDHDICYGARPDFEDIFSKYPAETGSTEIGVFVCGPESMKESVASFCKNHSSSSMIAATRKKPHFNLHSLNFSL